MCRKQKFSSNPSRPLKWENQSFASSPQSNLLTEWRLCCGSQSFQNWTKMQIFIRLPLIWSYLTVWLRGAGILSIFNIRFKNARFFVLLWARAALWRTGQPSLHASMPAFHATNFPFLSVVSGCFSSLSCLFFSCGYLSFQRSMFPICCYKPAKSLLLIAVTHNFLLCTIFYPSPYTSYIRTLCRATCLQDKRPSSLTSSGFQPQRAVYH